MDLNLPPEKSVAGPAILWRRIAAFLMDLLIMDIVIQFSFGGLFARYIPSEMDFTKISSLFEGNVHLRSVAFALTFGSLMLIMLYFISTEYLMGQSIGKKVMNISVISTDSARPFPSLGQHILRNIFLIPFFPFILLWIADPVCMLLNSQRQRLSEIISKTRVVQTYPL